MTSKIHVKVGQIWMDKDPRRQNRVLEIKQIHDGAAYCLSRQETAGDTSVKNVRINLDRFNRYKLIRDAEGEALPVTDTPLGRTRELIRSRRAAQDQDV